MGLPRRLPGVMAWLRGKRAGPAGEMTRDEAGAREHRRAGPWVWGETEPPVEGSLQPRLAELLDRSPFGAYANVALGKWHLATDATGPMHPLLAGFQAHAGSQRNIGNYYHWPKSVNGVVGIVTDYATSDVVDDAAVCLMQLEIPDAPVEAAARRCSGTVVLNPAPARALSVAGPPAPHRSSQTVNPTRASATSKTTRSDPARK